MTWAAPWRGFPERGKALRAVGELRPDAAILDARLSDAAALQLTLSLRQRNIRIIYFASYDPRPKQPAG